MKKLLSLILILAMVLSVSSVALATECNDAACSHVASIGTNDHYDSLQAAINAAVDGNTITLLTDCAEDVTVVQAEGVKITIDGNGKTMTGMITVNGKSAAYATAGLTIKNVKFDASGISKDACINLGVSGDTNTRYVSNLTVQECTFTGAGQSKVAIKSYTGGDKNLTVTKCTVDSTMHSLLQVHNVTGVVIDDCTVNSKNGINLNHSSEVEIKNSDVSVSGYAVRMGDSGTGSGKVTMTNNTLATNNTEGDAVIVLRGSAVAGVDLDMTGNVVSGNTHISGNTDATDISANANYWDGKTAPVSSQEVKVDSYYTDEAKTNLVAPDAVAKIGTTTFKTLAEAVAAADDGDTITLLDDCSGDGIVIEPDKFSSNGLVIDFNNHTYTVTGPAVGSSGTETLGMQINKGNKVTLKNGKLTSADTATSGVKMLINNYADLTLQDMVLDGSGITDNPTYRYTLSNNSGNVVIEDTDIIAPTDGVAFDVYKYAGYAAPEVTVKGESEITGKIEVAASGSASGTGDPTLKIEDGEVNGAIAKTAGTISISGGTFSEQPKDEWIVPTKGAVENSDGKWGLVDAVSSNRIKVYPAVLNFGTVQVGYDRPAAQTVYVSGTNAVTVSGSEYFDISDFDMANGTFTVQPKAGLPAGNYNFDLTVQEAYPTTTSAAVMSAATTDEGPKVQVNFVVEEKPGSGKDHWVKYNGGNSFSTNKKEVPTSVEIDGVPVPFSGDGRNFTVSCILSGAERITVRWQSTSVTTNFKPDANVFCGSVDIPKTGDMPFWAAVAAFFGF